MTKTIIASLLALTLGASAAMADGEGPVSDYWGERNREMIAHVPAQADYVGAYRSFVTHATPAQNDAGTVGGDGSGG